MDTSDNNPNKQAFADFILKRPPHLRPAQSTLLEKWLMESGTSKQTFANRVGVVRRTVDWWADGRVIPTLVAAFRIEQVTEGAVPVASWLGLDIGRALWEQMVATAEKEGSE